eukprot:4766653-Pleurochrysis_carterae.AAC.1
MDVSKLGKGTCLLNAQKLAAVRADGSVRYRRTIFHIILFFSVRIAFDLGDRPKAVEALQRCGKLYFVSSA